MNQQRKLWLAVVITLFIITGLALSLFRLNAATNASVNKKVEKIDQNPIDYLGANYGLGFETQQAKLEKFLVHYYSPWGDKLHSSENVRYILLDLKSFLNHSLTKRSWGLNYHFQNKAFLQSLVNNANLKNFPSVNKPGIIVQSSPARMMPTLLPSFNNPNKAGEGFPFDNWQASYLDPGTPVWILHETKDGLWSYVLTSSYEAWVLSSSVAAISPELQKEWRNHEYLVSLEDWVPALTTNDKVASWLRMGVIYPIYAEEENYYRVLFPIADAFGKTQLVALRVKKDKVSKFPLPAQSETVAKLMRSFMGSPYGWGELYDVRDCSATTSNLYALFGIWLPRNSSSQAAMAPSYSLAGLTNQQKLKLIKDKGVPFFTLVHFPGHVGVYLGEKNGQLYFFQDAWGVHTLNLLGQEGRAIIGKTIITPFDFEQGFSNIKDTWLDRMDKIIMLN